MQDWKHLETAGELSAVLEASNTKPQLIFKHSIRCGISAQVWDTLARSTDQLNTAADLHFLDLINYRGISNQVAAELNVPHQSPQVILVHNGKATYDSSHFSIRPEKIVKEAEAKLA